MLSWIITTSIIIGFSAAALELFGEDTPADHEQLATHQLRQEHAFVWQQMTDADFDALMGEFLVDDNQAGRFAPRRA